jgi:hypothetical protein
VPTASPGCRQCWLSSPCVCRYECFVRASIAQVRRVRPPHPPARGAAAECVLACACACVRGACVRACVCPAGHRAALWVVRHFDRACTPTLQLCTGGELPGDLRSFVRDGEILASAERAAHAQQHVHGEAAQLAAQAGARPDASAAEHRRSEEGIGSERSGGADPGVVRLLDRRAGNSSQKSSICIKGLYLVNILNTNF